MGRRPLPATVAKCDQIAALLRDKGPCTTNELRAMLPAWDYQEPYRVLRRLERSGIVSRAQIDGRSSILWLHHGP